MWWGSKQGSVKVISHLKELMEGKVAVVMEGEGESKSAVLLTANFIFTTCCDQSRLIALMGLWLITLIHQILETDKDLLSYLLKAHKTGRLRAISARRQLPDIGELFQGRTLTRVGGRCFITCPIDAYITHKVEQRCIHQPELYMLWNRMLLLCCVMAPSSSHSFIVWLESLRNRPA